MYRSVLPCIASKATQVPTGTLWVHEIKHDGYRMMVRRRGGQVRLITRRGADFTDRYPLIVEVAKRIPVDSFTLNGEAVWCGKDGISDFDTLHAQGRNEEVFLYAFDLLHLGGEAFVERPLEERKRELKKLVGRRRHIRIICTICTKKLMRDSTN